MTHVFKTWTLGGILLPTIDFPGYKMSKKNPPFEIVGLIETK